MKESMKSVFKGQVFTSLIYLALGLCLVIFPSESVNIICKVVFGIVLILAGLYHIWTYLSEDGGSSVFNLFTGAILLVLGVFFFQNPQIVAMILPSLLASLLLVDSIWTLRAGLRLKKYGRNEWQFFVIVSLIFVTLGIVLYINPFTDMKYTVLFAGWSFIGDAILDVVSMILFGRGNKAIEKDEALKYPETLPDSTIEKKKERKGIFSFRKRKDAEIIVTEDVDMKASEVSVSEADTVEEAGKKKGFAAGFFGKLRKSKGKTEDIHAEQVDEAGTENINAEEEADRVQEVFKLEEEPDKVQEVFKLEEEPDKVQEVFKLEEEPDKVQDIFKLEEEPNKIQDSFRLEDDKAHIEELLKLDKNILGE